MTKKLLKNNKLTNKINVKYEENTKHEETKYEEKYYHIL